MKKGKVKTCGSEGRRWRTERDQIKRLVRKRLELTEMVNATFICHKITFIHDLVVNEPSDVKYMIKTWLGKAGDKQPVRDLLTLVHTNM